MCVASEEARSMAVAATMSVASASQGDPPEERRRNVAAAKVQIGRSARLVGQQSIQLHGGIGMTMEAKIGHYFKRLTMIENTFGDTDYHLRRVTDSGGVVFTIPHCNFRGENFIPPFLGAPQPGARRHNPHPGD